MQCSVIKTKPRTKTTGRTSCACWMSAAAAVLMVLLALLLTVEPLLFPLVLGHDVKLKESDFLQQSEPTFVETTTTEMDPLTQERITRTVQVVTTTTTVPMAGGIAVTDDLRESMQKIVDQFMTEERKGQ
uniref:Uncharacterized protein n=1 Tax=Vespula pensylvanica TaxID=30213 RepID=A0A834UHB3_VESPE|nr:hypothetical protein H0235_001520 [Vespula pensylvanica]